MSGTELIDPTCPVVKNMLLLDSDGKRIAVKYYSPEWCVAERLLLGGAGRRLPGHLHLPQNPEGRAALRRRLWRRPRSTASRCVQGERGAAGGVREVGVCQDLAHQRAGGG